MSRPGSRKLADQARSKAIVNDAWTRIKEQFAVAPNWPYIGVVALVDRMLDEGRVEDGRDIGDALVLCHELGLGVTKRNVLDCMVRVGKGRNLGTGSYR